MKLKMIDAEQQIIDEILRLSSEDRVLQDVGQGDLREIINFFLSNQFKQNPTERKRFIGDKILEIATEIVDNKRGAIE